MTSMWAPWTNEAASEARKMTAAATSSIVPTAAEGRGGGQAREVLLRPAGRHRAVDDAGVDAVRRHAVRPRVAGERLRERDDAALRRRVGGARREPADLARERAERDDAAAALRHEHAQRRLRGQEDAAQVDGQQQIPLLRRELVERASRGGCPRSRRARRAGRSARARCRRAAARPPAARRRPRSRARDVRAELGRGRGGRLGVQVAEHDARALGDERAGAGEADPAGAARDDRDLAARARSPSDGPGPRRAGGARCRCRRDP